MPDISKITHLFAYGVYLALTGVARLLPLKLVFAAGEGVGAFGYLLLRNRRRVAKENLMLALDLPDAEAEALARRHFLNLGANMLSALKIATMSDEEIRKCVTMEIPPELHKIAAGGGDEKSWVAMISHMGNWEIFSHLSPLFPYFRYGAIYHKLANDYVDRHFKETRARSGVTLFDRREGYLKCVSFLKEGGVVGVLVDQYAGIPGTWMPFFRRLTSTSTLAATLAQRAGVKIVPIAIATTGRAKWRVTVSLPFEAKGEIEAVTDRINRELEKQIRESPEDWLWSHNRWKTPKWVFLFSRAGRRTYYPPDFDQSKLIPYRVIIRGVNDPEEAKVSMPGVKAVKRGRPDMRVTLVAPAAQAAFWREVAEVDELITVEEGESASQIAAKIKESGRYDAGILFSNTRRAALELWLGEIPYRIGPPYRFLLNVWKNGPGLGEPPAQGEERYRRIVEGVGAAMD